MAPRRKTGGKQRRATNQQQINDAPTWTIEEWDVDSLHPHPLQEVHFSALADHEFEGLVGDIQRRGLEHALDVLPAGNAAGLRGGTVVCGHQRLAAAKQLGWTKIRVRVRHDLVAQSAAEIESLLISDNYHRRQLSRLERARNWLRLLEIELGSEPGGLYDFNLAEPVKRLAEAKGKCERTIRRDLDILRAPAEVQAAYESGALRVTPASQVCRLPEATQREIAERIRAGEDPETVVQPLLKQLSKGSTPKNALRRASELLKRVAEALPSDAEHAAAACPLYLARELLDTLDQLTPTLTTLSSSLQKSRRESEQRLARAITSLRST